MLNTEKYFWRYNPAFAAYEYVRESTGQIIGRVWEKLGYWVLVSVIRRRDGEFATRQQAMDALVYSDDSVTPYVDPAPTLSPFRRWVNRIMATKYIEI